MESVLRLIQHVSNEKLTEEDKMLAEKKKSILCELKEVRRLTSCNDLWFQLECNSDLIEACIFQRKALQARYRYLLGEAKSIGITCPPELMHCLGV